MPRLHLPGPHLCPVCNVVHKIGAEALPRNLAELLRPYYATYTPSKFPPAAELYLAGTFGGTMPSTYAAMTFTSTHADTSLAATPSSSSWTILKTGVYVVMGIVSFIPLDAGGETNSLRVMVNGSQVAVGSSTAIGNGNGMEAAAFWRGAVTAGQVVAVQGQNTFTRVINGGSALIEFVPTAANPQ